MQFPELCKLGLGLASPEYQHRTQILWQLSIILFLKHSFPITKKESSNEDCIVVFLAEKFVQIVDEVITVKEEKDEGNTKKNTIWTNFSAKNTTI